MRDSHVILILAMVAPLITAAFSQERDRPQPPPEVIDGQEEGLEALEESDFVARYRDRVDDSGEPIDHYNLGTALLAEERWAEAREPLGTASRDEKDVVREYGTYNYGIASALAGHLGDEDEEARRSELLAARQAFRSILRDDPVDENTRWNLELVEKWLEEQQQSGGEGQSGGEAQSDPGGGGEGAPQSGHQGGDRQPITPEEAAALLDSAGRAESSIRDRMLGRTRFRDPVVERNW